MRYLGLIALLLPCACDSPPSLAGNVVRDGGPDDAAADVEAHFADVAVESDAASPSDAPASDGPTVVDSGGADAAADASPSELTDDALAALPSAIITQITVPDYFPMPPVGETIINEFAMTSSSGEAKHHWTERFSNPGGGVYYLEDYLVQDNGQLVWYDTWVLKRVDGHVVEVFDTLNPKMSVSCDTDADGCLTFDQYAQPLDHGAVLIKGLTFQSTAESTQRKYPSGEYVETDVNIYAIHLSDIKAQVTLPAGVFADVAVQDESQHISIQDGPSAGFSFTEVYRFYMAPGVGIIARQFWSDSLNPGMTYQLEYLHRTCRGTDEQYNCP